MGIYLVDVGAQDWSAPGEDGWGDVAVALNEELRRRGLPAYESVPEKAGVVRGSGQTFEEKLIPSMDGFSALCRSELSRAEADLFCGWTVLVPLSLDEPIEVPVESGYSDTTVFAGAPQVLAIAERLAAVLELPDETPEMCDNLDLTNWFMDGSAKQLAAVRRGRWSDDLDTAFYVAMYLRAAQHSLRRSCPIAYS